MNRVVNTPTGNERMKREEVTFNLDSGRYVLRAMSGRAYREASQHSISISEDYDLYLMIHHLLLRQNTTFKLDRATQYAALKTLFGESTTMYDEYKCSFSFPFYLTVIKGDKQFEYVLHFTDFGTHSFKFRRRLNSDDDVTQYGHLPKSILQPPFADEFSRDEMRHLVHSFISYLHGFIQVYAPVYDDPFARTVERNQIVYGYSDGQFFTEQYQDNEAYLTAKSCLVERNIPMNRVTLDDSC